MEFQKRFSALALLAPFGVLLLSHLTNAFEEDSSHYNPDMNLDTAQTIRRHGYPVEAHTVETADGYILALHRIPSGRIKGSRGPCMSDKRRSKSVDETFSPNTVDSSEPSDVILSSLPMIPGTPVQTSIPSDTKIYSRHPKMLGDEGPAPASTTLTPTTTSNPNTTETTTSATTTTTPAPRARLPILLLHGLMGSSYAWIIAGPKKGLAYLLADAGYDVWMANARGCKYSRAHVCLPTNPSSIFWDFSFHEIGVYDLPAAVEHVLGATGAAQLHFVGHSMGATAFFAMAAARPEVAARVASAHALAPVVFAAHMRSPLRLLAPFACDVEFLARILGRGQLLPESKITQLLAKYGCETLDIEKKLCRNLIFILYGFDPEQFDMNLLPLLLSHASHGASTKTVIHYAQLVNSGKFQQFDYGPMENMRIYNSLVPPSYNISKIKVPVHLYYASNDWLASTTDVDTLFQSLRCKKTKYLVPLPPFNHIDFILAKDVKKLVYDTLLKQLPQL